MNAHDIWTFLLDRAPWIDPEHTVDGIILGRPDREVRRILVVWLPTLEALTHAAEHGFDLVMAHEPTFYAHMHEDRVMDQTAAGRRKRALLEAHDMVLMRNHDIWDRMPEVGIPWALGRYLGFAGPPVRQSAEGFQHRYDIRPVSLDDLARRIAHALAGVGEPMVQVAGDGHRMVSRIGVGTGCICSPDTFLDLGCDVSIVVDDGTFWWHRLQQARDEGHPIIRIHHGSAEDPGMATLTRYLNDHLPGVEAVHLPYRGAFRLVG